MIIPYVQHYKYIITHIVATSYKPAIITIPSIIPTYGKSILEITQNKSVNISLPSPRSVGGGYDVWTHSTFGPWSKDLGSLDPRSNNTNFFRGPLSQSLDPRCNFSLCAESDSQTYG